MASSTRGPIDQLGLVVGRLPSERGELNGPTQEMVPVSSMVYVRTRECPWKYRVNSIDNFDVDVCPGSYDVKVQ